MILNHTRRTRPLLIKCLAQVVNDVARYRSVQSHDKGVFIAHIFESVTQQNEFLIGQNEPVVKVITLMGSKLNGSVLNRELLDEPEKDPGFAFLRVRILAQKPYWAVHKTIQSRQSSSAIVRVTYPKQSFQCREQL